MRAEAIYISESCILVLNIPYLRKVNKEKRFSCGIITTDAMNRMTSEQFELCSTIARDMCYAANQNPDKIFKLGIKASVDQKKTNSPKKDDSNVIDFLKYLQIKRERN